MDKMLIAMIEREFGTETSAKIKNDIAYKSNICILYSVDVRERTPESFEKECEAYHVRYPNRNMENYRKLMASQHKDKFTFVIEPTGYFIDEAQAEHYAVENICDINEAGSFPYVVLSQVPLNQMYPFGDPEDKKRLFLFDMHTQKYEEISWDYNEATKALLDRGNHGAF